MANKFSTLVSAVIHVKLLNIIDIRVVITILHILREFSTHYFLLNANMFLIFFIMMWKTVSISQASVPNDKELFILSYITYNC